jgi:hypothetical protein
MPTILGTYPILNSESANTNVDGIEFINYVFTVPTSTALANIPKPNEAYYGPIVSTTGSSFVAKPGTGSAGSYRVISSSVENLSGGLSQISVQTAGASDAQAAAPRIRILTNYPLIFGLGSISGNIPQNSYRGAGLDTAGYGVMVNFITNNDIGEETEVFNTYSQKIMPAEFRGVPTPVPTRQPFSITGGSPTNSYQSVYKGFICKSTTLQRIGGVILWELTYSESGKYIETLCEGSGENAQCTQSVAYDYIS